VFVERRLLCFALFWHALDIIWVWLLTVVYLLGVQPHTHLLNRYLPIWKRKRRPACSSTASDLRLP
jgi:hypothetical protein